MKKRACIICLCIFLMILTIPFVESQNNTRTNSISQQTFGENQNGNWTEIQKLLALDGGEDDYFGVSVSLSGDTALVGADYGAEDYKGAAYVFIRIGSTWVQQAKLLALDGAYGDHFGSSVFLDGNTAIIGADVGDGAEADSGSAYVFTRTGTSWSQQQKLTASDGAKHDSFGSSVALEQDTILIGAPYDDEYSGSVYVFVQTQGIWVQQQKLLIQDAMCAHFGCSVSLDDTTALIGAEYSTYNGLSSGSAYVFTHINTTWTQQTMLLASDSAELDFFGHSVSLDEDTALIGAVGGFLVGPGSAYVFTRLGTNWTFQQKLLVSNSTIGDNFGECVSIEGDTAFIGASVENNWSGSVYFFTRLGTIWTEQQKLYIPGSLNFGSSVALDGRSALIGAKYDDENGYCAGSAFVFIKDGDLPIAITISGGLGVNAVITNNDTTNVNDVPWQIHVKGGILRFLDESINGTTDVKAKESVQLSTGLIFGIGKITITVRVAEKEKIATGVLFLFIVFGVR